MLFDLARAGIATAESGAEARKVDDDQESPSQRCRGEGATQW